MLMRGREGLYKIWVGKHVGPADGMSDEARLVILERRTPEDVAQSASLVLWYVDGEVRVVDSTTKSIDSCGDYMSRVAPVDYVVKLDSVTPTVEIDSGSSTLGWSGWTDGGWDAPSYLVGIDNRRFDTFYELLGYIEGVLFARKGAW